MILHILQHIENLILNNMPIEKFYTIGVYGLSEDQYFSKLLENKIDAFVDIRQRRAVRGSKYSFVNSTKLQNKLSALGIKYFHVLELAPTTEIRELQKKDDVSKGIKKIDRCRINFLDTPSKPCFLTPEKAKRT